MSGGHIQSLVDSGTSRSFQQMMPLDLENRAEGTTRLRDLALSVYFFLFDRIPRYLYKDEEWGRRKYNP
jgi:hypothetical protein